MYTVNPRLSARSPTVVLWKGAYRMRLAPALASPPPHTVFGKNSLRVRAEPHTHERRLVLFLFTLVCGTLACFRAAYHLFTTRYATPAARDADTGAPRVAVATRTTPR
ncbi:hypothetical protein CERSUDRAFT_100906 [Gelatoporia subvermispora B]|uniref:Uncharacterized protein n=1 Tax=Ceriporiopsis subvermispora (strain B) TaxID=914234 RepID=M2QY98_CERS8|nr:hypothetical protein CERSUDRAFT_100906 [Gelatoporia subvermispora B]